MEGGKGEWRAGRASGGREGRVRASGGWGEWRTDINPPLPASLLPYRTIVYTKTLSTNSLDHRTSLFWLRTKAAQFSRVFNFLTKYTAPIVGKDLT